MKAKCIDNRYGNTNFKAGKIYDFDINGIATEWGGIRVRSKIEPTNGEFNIGLCKFKVIKEGR